MIKIIIVVILILLLIITIYSYYCLTSRMVNYERERLEYILQKENEVKTKESKVNVVADCSNKNEQYQAAFANINKIIGDLHIKGVCDINDVNEKNMHIIKSVENVISGKIDPEVIANPKNIQSCLINNNNDANSLINQESIHILNEVPTEHIQ